LICAEGDFAPAEKQKWSGWSSARPPNQKATLGVRSKRCGGTPVAVRQTKSEASTALLDHHQVGLSWAEDCSVNHKNSFTVKNSLLMTMTIDAERSN
jgi:hypothetical protein